MSRHPRVLRVPAGGFQGWLDSWELSMQGELLSERTVTMYSDIGVLFAGWLRTTTKVRDWDGVGRTELRQFFKWMYAGGAPCPHQLDPAAKTVPRCDGYGKSYVNNAARGLQQFFAWFAQEEELPNPMVDLRVPSAPKMGDQVVPVLDQEALAALVHDADVGRDYTSRRDAAVLRLAASTGVRLGELAGLDLEDIDLKKREALVTGKAGKQRPVKFDARTALAIDRYLRMRRKRVDEKAGLMSAAAVKALWIGERRFVPMTEKGLYQAIVKRGKRIGLRVYPHLLRHTFSHRWLDSGGSEGDLMELNGWDSPSMLALYGRSARSARARRSYDHVDVMGGI